MEKGKEYKNFLIRMPKELWTFFKLLSIEKEESVNKIINECLEEYKKNNYNHIDIK